ncbi:MAG: 4a-hydroxytetrahydrobiopterin dehydratase [Thermoleophilaceae bacterium]|jgi:4a-hydroxytetrahydrobiopterin dehydratase|nr:4a-hydroxytetrahydrobiopterin dehydratase [Thermoleophilaceae bacterium]
MALLSDEEIESRLGALPGWERKAKALRRNFRFDDFVGSVDFVNRVVPVAEEMNHHPDVAISWNEVAVAITTHSQGGITDSDFALAREIDGVA